MDHNTIVTEVRRCLLSVYSRKTVSVTVSLGSWITRLLYDGGHIEPRSGIIVSTVDEVEDIYCDNGCVCTTDAASRVQPHLKFGG